VEVTVAESKKCFVGDLDHDTSFSTGWFVGFLVGALSSEWQKGGVRQEDSLSIADAYYGYGLTRGTSGRNQSITLIANFDDPSDWYYRRSEEIVGAAMHDLGMAIGHLTGQRWFWKRGNGYWRCGQALFLCGSLPNAEPELLGVD
jgi:hypothetical protein